MPFSRQSQGEEIIIGRVETGQFLALLPDAVEILEDLAGGATVGEAQDLYRSRYGETPEIEDFLTILEARGFVRYWDAPELSLSGTAPPERKPSHFAWISPNLARRLFGKPMLAGIACMISLALSAVILDPSIVPGRRSFYFESHRSLAVFSLLIWNLFTVFVHELGHLVAARAVGVPARIGLSHRLWILVAETDLTGLWSLPQRQRYLPILAGPLVDLFSLSLLLLLFKAQKAGWIALQHEALHFAQAIALGYMLRLLWQCLFFVRTDFYFALVTLLGSTNLLSNTHVFLRNQVARVIPWLRPVSQNDLPLAESRAVRFYAPFYLAGRLIAFWSLFFISLPVLWRYLASIATILSSGYRHNPFEFIDSLGLGLLIAGPSLAGLVLWIRSLLTDRSISR